MGNGNERRYPDEFAIVDGIRERRTIEDGVIVSFDLPTVYTENGEIDADATTAYRKSIADAASTVAGLCAAVHTTPWRSSSKVTPSRSRRCTMLMPATVSSTQGSSSGSSTFRRCRTCR